MTNPKMTKEDLSWIHVFLGIFFTSFIASIFIAIGYLVPLTLDYPNSLPRQGNDGLIEFAIVFVFFTIGIFLPIVIICLISRKHISLETYNRWACQFESGKDNVPKLTRWLGSYILKK
jgi:hypothetical protein